MIAKGGLILESFSLWHKPQKKVPNHATKKIVLSDGAFLFWRFEQKGRTF